MLVGAPRNCSRFVCRYGFHEDVLDSVYVPIILFCCLYCCTRTQYFALAIILSDSDERMRRDKIPPQRMHAACRIVTRGSCCTKRFAEFNSNCESFCSLEQRRYPPQMRGNLLPVRIIRRQKATSEDIVQTTRFVVLWGVHLDYYGGTYH